MSVGRFNQKLGREEGEKFLFWSNFVEKKRVKGVCLGETARVLPLFSWGASVCDPPRNPRVRTHLVTVISLSYPSMKNQFLS